MRESMIPSASAVVVGSSPHSCKPIGREQLLFGLRADGWAAIACP